MFGYRIIHVFHVVMNYHLHAYFFNKFLNFKFYNMDFEVLTLAYQVCLFVDHLTYEFILCYFFDFYDGVHIIILNVLSFFFIFHKF
jgi:hypothetical protein